MKVYQIIIPAFVCVLAAILASCEADDEFDRLNNRLYEITKELEDRLREKQMQDVDLIFADGGDKRGMKKANRPWSSFVGQTGIAFGKRTDGLERERELADQRDKKTRSRFFGHSALAFGKRYMPQDLWDAQDAANVVGQYDEIPVKKAMGFTGNTGILLGKRNAEDVEE